MSTDEIVSLIERWAQWIVTLTPGQAAMLGVAAVVVVGIAALTRVLRR